MVVKGERQKKEIPVKLQIGKEEKGKKKNERQ